MNKREKWLELKKRLKSAVFLEIVFWIILLALIFSIGYGIFYHKFIKPNLYTITFNDIDGIINGSPVRFMGLVSGHVRKLTYHKDSIEVQIIITKKNMKIPPGSVASVEFSGIAGSKSIEIMPPENNLADIGIISKDTLRITDVLDEYMYIGKVFASLKDFVDAINQDTVLKVFSTVKEASSGLEKADESIEEGQSNTENLTNAWKMCLKARKNLKILWIKSTEIPEK